MIIHTYTKLHEPLEIFNDIIDIIKKNGDELLITTESKRCFRELELIKEVNTEIIYLVSSLQSLGLNDADIATQLNWFIENQVKLVICEIPSTYEFGVSQPINKAVLSSLLQFILNARTDIVTVPFYKKSTAGRNKLPFPDNWDELYEKWSQKEITSKDFMDKSGLKKATFYNMLTEYKHIQENNSLYLKKYKIV